MTGKIFKLLENPVLSSLIGVIIGSAVSIITAYLNNKNQKEIARINVTYRHRLRIITGFLNLLVEIRYLLEDLVYVDPNLNELEKYRKILLSLKQRLIEIRLTEKELYCSFKSDLDKLYNLTRYLLNIIEVLRSVPEDVGDETINKTIEKMKQFINTAEKLEKGFFYDL